MALTASMTNVMPTSASSALFATAAFLFWVNALNALILYTHLVRCAYHLGAISEISV